MEKLPRGSVNTVWVSSGVAGGCVGCGADSIELDDGAGDGLLASLDAAGELQAGDGLLDLPGVGAAGDQREGGKGGRREDAAKVRDRGRQGAGAGKGRHGNSFRGEKKMESARTGAKARRLPGGLTVGQADSARVPVLPVMRWIDVA